MAKYDLVGKIISSKAMYVGKAGIHAIFLKVSLEKDPAPAKNPAFTKKAKYKNVEIVCEDLQFNDGEALFKGFVSTGKKEGSEMNTSYNGGLVGTVVRLRFSSVEHVKAGKFGAFSDYDRYRVAEIDEGEENEKFYFNDRTYNEFKKGSSSCSKQVSTDNF